MSGNLIVITVAALLGLVRHRSGASRQDILIWVLLSLMFGLYTLIIFLFYYGKLFRFIQELLINISPHPNWKDKILQIIFLAPAPFYMCFDGCVGGEFFAPLIVSWMPLLSIFSYLSWQRWLWHIGFMILFGLLYYPLVNLANSRPGISAKQKRTNRIVIYIAYWIIIAWSWSLIPIITRQVWLGQNPF